MYLRGSYLFFHLDNSISYPGTILQMVIRKQIMNALPCRYGAGSPPANAEDPCPICTNKQTDPQAEKGRPGRAAQTDGRQQHNSA